jgi:hypothetical protein
MYICNFTHIACEDLSHFIANVKPILDFTFIVSLCHQHLARIHLSILVLTVLLAVFPINCVLPIYIILVTVSLCYLY